MAIITTQNVKDYLRIETAAEDVLLAELILEAYGEVESYVGKSLATETATWYDDANTLRLGEGVVNLILRYAPIDPTSVVIKDAQGALVDATTYIVRLDRGLIMSYPQGGGSFIGGPYSTFDAGPYTITCTAGIGTSPTYTYRELPMIRRVLIDWTAMLYQQRTLGARTEKSAGTMVDYSEIDATTGLPVRIASVIRKLKGIVGGVF
jgi:uncharacterized phiE125 gp8 family phage protein